MSDRFRDDEPCYVISIAAKLVQLHPQTLRYYDRIGLIRPSRSGGRIRLYSQSNIEALRKIVRLTEELGVNLAGVEVIMNMTQRIEDLQRRLRATEDQAQAEIKALYERLAEIERKETEDARKHQVINVSAREITGRPKEEKP